MERIWYAYGGGAEKCEREQRSNSGIAEFREDGHVVRTEHRNPDGSTGYAQHDYDDAGRLTTVRSEDRTGEHVRSHEYGPDGRLARIVARSGSGEPRVLETHEYDAAGGRTKTFYVDLPPDTNMAFGVEGSESAYSASGAAAVHTVYNEREQPAAMIFFSAAGREISRVELSYDGNGNLIGEAQIREFVKTEMFPAETLATVTEAQMEAMRALFDSMRRTHRYDERGRRVETLSHMGMLGDDRRTMTYNEYGDRTGELSEHIERQYEMDDRGNLSETPTRENTSRSESRIQYEYDARGNWVTKTVEGRGGPDQEFSVSSIERRVIGYFE
jgi:hypothetical protein